MVRATSSRECGFESRVKFGPPLGPSPPNATGDVDAGASVQAAANENLKIDKGDNCAWVIYIPRSQVVTFGLVIAMYPH